MDCAGGMKLEPNIDRADEFVARLFDAQEHMSIADALAFNSRLALLLANQVGDSAVLFACIEAALESPER
jgi:propanediol dehydratase large subunit